MANRRVRCPCLQKDKTKGLDFRAMRQDLEGGSGVEYVEILSAIVDVKIEAGDCCFDLRN
jgi:hypothetical protein